jgi:hypothetical protein
VHLRLFGQAYLAELFRKTSWPKADSRLSPCTSQPLALLFLLQQTLLLVNWR